MILIEEPDRKVVNGKYKLSEEQAKAILDLRLHRLTGLERDKIHQELRDIGEAIKEFLSILASRENVITSYSIHYTKLYDLGELLR